MHNASESACFGHSHTKRGTSPQHQSTLTRGAVKGDAVVAGEGRREVVDRHKREKHRAKGSDLESAPAAGAKRHFEEDPIYSFLLSEA